MSLGDWKSYCWTLILTTAGTRNSPFNYSENIHKEFVTAIFLITMKYFSIWLHKLIGPKTPVVSLSATTGIKELECPSLSGDSGRREAGSALLLLCNLLKTCAVKKTKFCQLQLLKPQFQYRKERLAVLGSLYSASAESPLPPSSFSCTKSPPCQHKEYLCPGPETTFLRISNISKVLFNFFKGKPSA